VSLSQITSLRTANSISRERSRVLKTGNGGNLVRGFESLPRRSQAPGSAWLRRSRRLCVCEPPGAAVASNLPFGLPSQHRERRQLIASWSPRRFCKHCPTDRAEGRDCSLELRGGWSWPVVAQGWEPRVGYVRTDCGCVGGRRGLRRYRRAVEATPRDAGQNVVAVIPPDAVRVGSSSPVSLRSEHTRAGDDPPALSADNTCTQFVSSPRSSS
jgi:hypothetical protein